MVSSKDSVSASLPAVVPPPLPPSVEEAYKKKCIELKRRLNEVEENNDLCHLRKIRMERAIRKMRLERAILLDALGKRMRKHGSDGFNGVFDDESEGSSEGPPTPQEKPLRSKRGHRRPAQSLHSSNTRHAISAEQFLRRGHSAYSTPIAPHPGPASFAHVNGSATSNPSPLQPFPFPLRDFGRDIDGRLLRPPPAKVLYSRHLMHQINQNRENFPNLATEEDEVNFCNSSWESLPARDRDPWEQEAATQLEEWAEDMEVEEDWPAQPAMSSQGGAGDFEKEGEEYKMEGVESGERNSGGFAAINT